MIKKIWGLIPIIINLLLLFILSILEDNDLVLREVPFAIYYTLLLLSILIFILYIGIILTKHTKKIIHYIANTFLVLLSVIICFLSLFGYAFGICGEHIVTKNKTKMVARVESFTDVFVYYYQYKGPIFRGNKQLGYEWYGSGGYDPFTTSMNVKPKTSTFKKDNNN